MSFSTGTEPGQRESQKHQERKEARAGLTAEAKREQLIYISLKEEEKNGLERPR